MLPSRQSLKWAVTAIAATMLTSAAAQAAVIHVPGDYLTIQEAIDAAFNGDEIVVAPAPTTRTSTSSARRSLFVVPWSRCDDHQRRRRSGRQLHQP